MKPIWIPLPGLDVEICTAPVLTKEFLLYEAATQGPDRHGRGALHLPIVGVSASAACRYAAWVGQQNGHVYRLPLLAEMQMLARTVKQAYPIWPCRPDPWDRTKSICPFEWLHCSPDYTIRRPSLHCATHPLWLLTPQQQIVKAALADDAMPYVTFRLVRLRGEQPPPKECTK